MANEFAVNSLGMLFIGFALATWFFGANTLQTYVYFQRYDDGLLLKAVVIIVFISDMFNTIFNCWGIYMELVQTPILPLQGNMQSNGGNYACRFIHKSILTSRFFSSNLPPRMLPFSSCNGNRISGSTCLDADVQSKLLRSKRIPSVLAQQMVDRGDPLTAASITSLYLVGKALPMANEVCIALALGLVTLTDVVITVTLVWYLFEGKSSLGPTSKLLDGLILYCVQRGILTTVSHVIVLVLWFALPTNWAWTLFQFSLGKGASPRSPTSLTF
ncbi:hypothetical protein OG21DRAFT_1486173 [Imleria badia]|nr:hypothetical protein OG21DRAFT_1486173 [Imleria badia]